MNLEEIIQLNERLQGTCWKNNKNGRNYFLMYVVFDATNSREGTPIVVYRVPGDYAIFARDLSEFKEKFTQIKD